MSFCTLLFERPLASTWRKRTTANEADIIMRKNLSVTDFETMMLELPNTVNVVGNAKSLLDKNLGSEIDKHYTIRFNWPRFRENQLALGNRCDWLHTNYIEKVHPSYFVKGLRVTASRNIVDIIIQRRIRGITTMTFLPEDIVSYYYQAYPQNDQSEKFGEQRPSAGYFFLQMIQDYSPHVTVNLYGFDFKRTNTHYVNFEHDTNKFHDYSFERESVLDMVTKNQWKIH